MVHAIRIELALRRFSYEQGEWVRRAILDGAVHAPNN